MYVEMVRYSGRSVFTLHRIENKVGIGTLQYVFGFEARLGFIESVSGLGV